MAIKNLGKVVPQKGVDYFTEEDISSLNIPKNISELKNDSGFITDYTESDPTVPAHVKAITQDDINKWNAGGNVDLSNYATTEYVNTTVDELEQKIPETYINPIEKNANMTQPVGVGTDGRLFTIPAEVVSSTTEGVSFKKHIGNLDSGLRLTGLPKLGDNVLQMLNGTTKHLVFRAKPNTTYVITLVSTVSLGNFGQANALGICTQVPGSGNRPLTQIGFMQTGGYGKYFVIKTNDNFFEDTSYLIWQNPGAADLTNVAIYEGESIDGYDQINSYSNLNGMATSDELMLSLKNLDDSVADSMAKANTSIQPEDLVYEPAKHITISGMSTFTKREIDDNALGDLYTIINSAVASKECLDTTVRLGSHYAHCPSVCIKDGKAYIVCFQNTESAVDSYLLEGTSTELFVVDVATMEVLSQKTIAGHDYVAGDLTFTYGSGAAQGVLINDNILRCVFVAKLSDEKWHQCYRDFDITTETFGDIGFCQIVSDGVSYDFITENVSLYIQEIADITKNTNIVCQPAKVGDTWYVACGCADQWENMPILTTKDWINFEYWATPSVEGNKAKFEMAIATDGNYLYTATRQIDTNDFLQLMKVNITDKQVSGHITIPDGNNSRPYIIYNNKQIYVSNILTTTRGNASQISRIQTNALYIGPNYYVTLPCMVYPTFAEYEGGYFVAYMMPYALYCCKLSTFTKYNVEESIGIASKLIELVAKK